MEYGKEDEEGVNDQSHDIGERCKREGHPKELLSKLWNQDVQIILLNKYKWTLSGGKMKELQALRVQHHKENDTPPTNSKG